MYSSQNAVVDLPTTSGTHLLSPTAKKEVEKALENKYYEGLVKLTEKTPAIMLSAKGVKNLPLLMKASHVRENIFSETEAKQKGLKTNLGINYHGLGDKLFLEVIDKLDEITEAYRGTKNAEKPERRENYFLLISKLKDKAGNEINVPIYISNGIKNKQYNQIFIDAHQIATVFGKNDLRSYIGEQIKYGNLVRIKKRNLQAGESTSPVDAGYGMEVPSDNKISQSEENVNTSDELFSSSDTDVILPADIASPSVGEAISTLEEATDSRGDVLITSETDREYLAAIENGDMNAVQRIVDEAASKALRNSKLRLPDGRLRKVYHGTNTGDFTEFDPDYIGMSSGDDGYFGMGFYFAYTEGEAKYYGAKRIIGAYLDISNPFNFEKELQTYKGKRASSGYAPDAVAMVNFADKFPEIAKDVTITVVEKGADDAKSISITEFAEKFKKVIENTEFKYEEVKNEFGESETLVYADPHVVEYEIDGKKYSYNDYGFQKRFWGTPNSLDVAYEYVSSSVFEYVEMYPRTRLILDNNREFTAALKAKGYDGTIQSEHGDEAVAFYPEQIKSADPVTYDDNGNVIPLSERFDVSDKDIRYSAADANVISTSKYSYDYFVQKPDMDIVQLDGTVPTSRQDAIQKGKQNAASVGVVSDNGTISVVNDDTDNSIIVNTDGLKHGLQRGNYYDPNFLVTLRAGEILKNAIRINELNPKKETANKSYVLIGTAQNKNGDLYIVRFVVNRYDNELVSMDVLYAINAKKESAALNAPRYAVSPLSVTDSKISISDLLDIVNKYFPDILPEEVLKHYGYSSRPDGELGKSALYSAGDVFVDMEFVSEVEKLNDENILLKAENAELKRHLNTNERQAFMPAARFCY